jgi:hypothetical protein
VKSFIRILAVTIALLISAHRLPAPIQEVPESPTPEQSTKPKPKRTVKPKASESSESSTKHQTSSPQPKNQATPTQLRFAGTWNGIMNCGMVGNIEHTIAIDAQNSMTVWQTNNPSARASGPAQISGDTITGTYGWNGTWAVTPYPDGQTAKVRFTAFLLDSTAVFRRESGNVASVAKETPAAPLGQQQNTIPTAKPVPGKPGFVYDPFDSNPNLLLDVRGRAPGTKVKDPAGRLFIVP